jgi:hypothetical protein
VQQFIAFAISLFVALSITNAIYANDSSRHIKFHLHPPSTAAPAGLSGGGPVGVGPTAAPNVLPGGRS